MPNRRRTHRTLSRLSLGLRQITVNSEISPIQRVGTIRPVRVHFACDNRQVKTLRLFVASNHLDSVEAREALDQAAEILRAGGTVAFPTETVYGLGANALDANAVAKIFALKRRPQTSPLIIHVSSIEMAREFVTAWPRQAEELAGRYWPGPLTLVLEKSPAIPDIVTAGLATVGVRIPAHPIALELIDAAGVPIAAPSANLFAGLSPTT